MTGLIVVTAGAVGSGVRYLVGAWLQRRSDPDLPVGTAAVNLVGSLLLGVVVGAGVSGHLLSALGGGLGGFTTYSTWMVETVALTRERRPAATVVNLLGLMVAGLALALLGLVLGRTI